VRQHLHELHELVTSSFEEAKAWCLPIPARGAKVEEMIDWIVGEERTVPNTVWQLNGNFVILAIEGVLNMLSNEGCQELSRLSELVASQDASVLQDVSDVVWKLVGQIVQRWWKPHGLPEALHRLETVITVTISGIDN
jgi:hypothetical protein